MRRLALIAAALLVGGPARADDQLRIGFNAASRYVAAGPDGTVAGFGGALARALCARAGLDCRLVFTGHDPQDDLAGLAAGEVDAFFPVIRPVQTLEGVVEAGGYVLPPALRYQRAARALPRDPADLVTLVTPPWPDMLYEIAPDARWLLLPRGASPVEALQRGEANAVLLRAPVGEALPLPEGLHPVGRVFRDNRGLAFGTRHGGEAALHRLDEALFAMKKDGTLNDLIRDELGAEEEGFCPPDMAALPPEGSPEARSPAFVPGAPWAVIPDDAPAPVGPQGLCPLR